MTVDRSAQRAMRLARALGTFIDQQYATYSHAEIVAALENALQIERELESLKEGTQTHDPRLCGQCVEDEYRGVAVLNPGTTFASADRKGTVVVTAAGQALYTSERYVGVPIPTERAEQLVRDLNLKEGTQ